MVIAKCGDFNSKSNQLMLHPPFFFHKPKNKFLQLKLEIATKFFSHPLKYYPSPINAKSSTKFREPSTLIK